MRAVNLIPPEERHGGGVGAAGRSGGAAYAMLGGLAVLVILIGAWAVTGRGLTDKRQDLAQLQRQAAQAKSQSDQLAGYDQFSTLRKQRVDTVRSLAASRFDWATAMNAISRTMPDDAWLTTMTGTVAPGVAVSGGGDTGSLRSSLPVPAVEIAGCTESQGKVARLMSRLRAIPGVDRVSLSDSTKSDGASSGGGSGDCAGSHANWPTFHMVLFFGRAVPPALPGATGTSTTASATTNPAATGAAGTSGSTSSTGSTGSGSGSGAQGSTTSSTTGASAPAPAPTTGASK